MGSIWSHVLIRCLTIVCKFSLFESTLQFKMKKQVILVWLQKDLPSDICNIVILFFNLCSGWLNFNFFLIASSYNIFIFVLLHFKMHLLIWCTFLHISLPPLLVKNRFPLSLPTLLLTNFPFPHLIQRIVLMIPFYPQLDFLRWWWWWWWWWYIICMFSNY